MGFLYRFILWLIAESFATWVDRVTESTHRSSLSVDQRRSKIKHFVGKLNRRATERPRRWRCKLRKAVSWRVQKCFCFPFPTKQFISWEEACFHLLTETCVNNFSWDCLPCSPSAALVPKTLLLFCVCAILFSQLLEISSCIYIRGLLPQQRWLIFHTWNILVFLKAFIFCTHMFLCRFSAQNYGRQYYSVIFLSQCQVFSLFATISKS